MHDTFDLSCARQRTERIALLNDAARQGRDRMARIVMRINWRLLCRWRRAAAPCDADSDS